ncbi:MAG: PQQ-binding-like beta-propeller repeat protein [Kiloniellales bacterium]
MCAVAFAALACGPGAAQERLALLAQPGPWSAVSGLVGYGERLWLVNSVLFVNHNSADIYSFDPKTGVVRYEAHLFSQGAGQPAVADGLLYWPFEDARSSVGRGEFMVTDGRRWAWHFLPQGQVFHVHAMIAHEGAIYAATSAWRAGVQRSDDGGRTWRVHYEHPSAPRTVSRFTTLAAFGGELYAGLTAWREKGVKLYRLTGNGAVPATAWPEGQAVTALAAYAGWLYGVNHGTAGSVLWRTNGAIAEPIAAFAAERVRDLAAADDRLWAVTARPGGGALWSSRDGVAWTLAQEFKGAQPADLAVYAGRVYVGTIGPQGRGGLWGPPPPTPVEAAAPTPAPPSPWRSNAQGLAHALGVLDRALAAPAGHAHHGEALRAAVRALVSRGSPAVGTALQRRLDRPGSDRSVRLFGGGLTVPAVTLERWYLLWGLAFNGHGRVPPAYLTAPWRQEPNPAEKYLEPAPMAMWAAGRLGQNDEATIAALIEALGRTGEAPWLNGDRIGALTALTGERFGYDFAGWRAWWAARRRAGPHGKSTGPAR